MSGVGDSRRKLATGSFPLLISATLLLLALPFTFASDRQARERGALNFHTRGCERCHSITGIGGKRAPDLGSVGLRRSPRQIRKQILQGGHGMPPFGEVLTRGEVEDLVYFLSSCRSDQAPGCRTWSAADAQ